MVDTRDGHGIEDTYIRTHISMCSILVVSVVRKIRSLIGNRCPTDSCFSTPQFAAPRWEDFIVVFTFSGLIMTFENPSSSDRRKGMDLKKKKKKKRSRRLGSP